MFDTFDPTKPEEEHYRTKLNNYLQANGGTGRLRWESTHQGLHHQLVWTAICYIDEIEYARATSNKLAHAMEEAAHSTHRALVFDIFRRRVGMVA